MINQQRDAQIVHPEPMRFNLPWLTRRRTFVLVSVTVAGFGLAMNWDWLTAVGAAPILLSLAPCLAMCALGLCMRGGTSNACRQAEASGKVTNLNHETIRLNEQRGSPPASVETFLKE